MLSLEIVFICILAMMLVIVRKEESSSWKARMPAGRIEQYWDGSERRRFVRFDTGLSMHYNVIRSGDSYEVVSGDVSEGGMRLLIDKKLERGLTIDMEIRTSKGGAAIRARGLVVWCNEAPCREELVCNWVRL